MKRLQRVMGKPLRICHVTTVHGRRDPRIFMKECVALAQAGHEVHLVVGDGRGDEVVDAVTIHDVGSRPVSRLRRMWAQPRRMARTLAVLVPDVVHFHDPELLPLGVRLARTGLRVIYDVHEDVPGTILSKHWIPRRLRGAVSRVFAAYERRSAHCLAGVVAATPHIARRFIRLGKRAVCVNNYPLPGEMAPPAQNVARQNRVCYVGGIARARGIQQVVQALPLVPHARLTLCGPINDAGLEAALRTERGWAQVDYLGAVDRETVRRVMAESCAGLVTYLPAPNHLDAQPTKLFEYMSAALPVIASDFPLWRQFVEDAGAGLCVDPESPQAIADAIRTILDHPGEVERMGRAGRDAVLSRYNWPAEGVRLVAFYENLSPVASYGD